MRVNRVIIKESGVLKNIDQEFAPVTLIVGDNERGKTHLMEWIARSLFEKPETSQSHEPWANKIGGIESTQFSVRPFVPYFDGARMKNLLFVQENDLLFKYRNPEENAKKNFWNQEIHALLYGSDQISDSLQKNMIRSLGVSKSSRFAWLNQLHDYLYNFKNSLEDLSEYVEKIASKEFGLYQLNDSLGSIDQIEKEIISKEEVYFLMDRVKLGEEYLTACEVYDTYRQKEEEYTKVQHFIQQTTEQQQDLEDKVVDVEALIQDKEHHLADVVQHEKDLLKDPQRIIKKSFSSQLFQMFSGLFFTCSGLYVAYLTMHTPTLTLAKFFALSSFVVGGLMLLSSYFKLLFLQSNSDLESNPLYRQYVQQAKRESLKHEHELKRLQQKKQNIRDEIAQIKKEIKEAQFHNEDLKQYLRINYTFLDDFQRVSYRVMDAFGSIEFEEIEKECEMIYHKIKGQANDFHYEDLKQLRLEKEQLLEDRSLSSTEYERNKTHIFTTIKSWLEDLKTLPCQDMVTHFYPELYRLELKDMASTMFYEVLEMIESILDRVSKDRYRAEKLYHLYQNVENNSMSLVSKALHSAHFEYLVQNIFGGKYKGFRIDVDDKKHPMISAETGYGDFIPLEELSSATFSQFWMILRFVLAKSILGKEEGIILLDDPFVNFDSVRKQIFVDLLNAFAHEGWQIICTLTDDPTTVQYFKDRFDPALKIIDLNKDYDDIVE